MQISRVLPLAALAAAVLALAGCDLHGSPSDSSAPAPTPHVRSRTSTPSTHTSESAPPVSSSGAPASSKPATPHTSAPPSKAVTSKPPVSSPPPAVPSTTSYDDLTVTLPVSATAVPGAPAGFVAYLTQVLTSDWQKLGSTPGCQKAPQVTVQKISSDGYALIGRTVDPALPNCSAAANEAGGYQAILQGTGGSWKQLVALQDAPSCKQMAKLGVPKSVYGECY
jgi:hypothetical protein